MTLAAGKLLDTFDRLPENDRTAVAREILRRVPDPSKDAGKIIGVGAFRSRRSDVSERAEEILREAVCLS